MIITQWIFLALTWAACVGLGLVLAIKVLAKAIRFARKPHPEAQEPAKLPEAIILHFSLSDRLKIPQEAAEWKAMEAEARRLRDQEALWKAIEDLTR